jgi:4-hydroxy-4-methyl-2-oxoglutarate aldolase
VSEVIAGLVRLGSATVYEASGRRGLIDVPLRQIVPGSRAAGPARTVLCGQGDNLMVHAAIAAARPGDVLVVTMPEPAAVALLGDLLATQAKARGVAAVLVDAGVRDVEELVALGLPIWARFVSIRGPVRHTARDLDQTVFVGGQSIEAGDIVVLDADGAVVVAQMDLAQTYAASLDREQYEQRRREQFEAGALSYDLDGLRAIVEPPSPSD